MKTRDVNESCLLYSARSTYAGSYNSLVCMYIEIMLYGPS